MDDGTAIARLIAGRFTRRGIAALEKTLLAQFELPADRKLKHLSRGMLMKAALLSSLAYRPKLLVLDEPFSGLDPLVREEFVRGVLEVSAQGDWTVLVSSHDIEEVERLADHVACSKTAGCGSVSPRSRCRAGSAGWR